MLTMLPSSCLIHCGPNTFIVLVTTSGWGLSVSDKSIAPQTIFTASDPQKYQSRSTYRIQWQFLLPFLLSTFLFCFFFFIFHLISAEMHGCRNVWPPQAQLVGLSLENIRYFVHKRQPLLQHSTTNGQSRRIWCADTLPVWKDALTAMSEGIFRLLSAGRAQVWQQRTFKELQLKSFASFQPDN